MAGSPTVQGSDLGGEGATPARRSDAESQIRTPPGADEPVMTALGRVEARWGCDSRDAQLQREKPKVHELGEGRSDQEEIASEVGGVYNGCDANVLYISSGSG